MAEAASWIIVEVNQNRSTGRSSTDATASASSPSPSPSPGSQLLHGVDRWAARPLIALVIVAADALWVVFSVVVDFPSRLETIFQTLVAALTLAMVFVIQHTQAKTSTATQRKLDELLRALPGADNTFISLELAAEQDLQQAADSHLQIRAAAMKLGDRDRHGT